MKLAGKVAMFTGAARGIGRAIALRYGQGAEIATAAVFLASAEASFVGGHILNVDGGYDAAGLIFDDEKPPPGK